MLKKPTSATITQLINGLMELLN